MQQRHPIKIDRSRAFPAGNDRHMTGSTQVSFHKIYRQKRCYSNLGRGKEGFSNSPQKYDSGYPSRESNGSFEPRYDSGHNARESNTTFEPNYLNPPGCFRNVQRNDFKEPIGADSPSSSCLSTGNVKSDRDFPKRCFDRFSCNFSPEPEFEATSVKKQKIDYNKSSALQQYISPQLDATKHKLSFDETKWMYKNHHAKMSGPYGLKQLMEGWQSRFLQEDLPIYQLYMGKLCKPIMLKELMDNVKQSQCESGRRHINLGISSPHFSQVNMEDRVLQEVETPATVMPGRRQSNQGVPPHCFTQVYREEGCAHEDDLPPGFGGRTNQLSKSFSATYQQNISASLAEPRCSAHSYSSLGSDFGDADIALPPGFEGGPPIESQLSEFCGTARNFSATAGLPSNRGDEVMHSGYDQLEHVVHDRVHSSWQGISSQSMLGHSNQGPKAGSELSLNGPASWTYHPTAVSFEPQMHTQPTLCIGLPVSQTTPHSWPSASKISSGNMCISTADPFRCCNESVLASDTMTLKESTSERHNPDPLSLILSELLAAVKRTYVSSVLSALIGEQLDFWFDANKHWLVRSSSFGSDSPRGTCQVSSRAEGGTCSVEGNPSQVEASASPGDCMFQVESLLAKRGHLDCLSPSMDGKGSQGRCLASDAVTLGESPQFSVVGSRTDLKAASLLYAGDKFVSSCAEDRDLGNENIPLCAWEGEKSLQVSDKRLESSLPTNEACMMSPKLSRSQGKECDPALQGSKWKTQSKVMEVIGNDDSTIHKARSSGSLSHNLLPNARQRLVTIRSKKENMKSLKQIMLITSKLKSARLKSSLLKTSGCKLLCSKSTEVLENSQRIDSPTSEEYNGCARTSLCCPSWKHQYHGEGQWAVYCRLQTANSRGSEVSTGLQTHAQSAQSCSISLGNLTRSLEDFDVTKLTQLKVSMKRMNVARSKIHRWGLFIGEAVETGVFIIEYLGELVRPRIAKIREELYEKSGIGSGYLFPIDHETTIDATKRGGLARFINHSCDPNCYIKVVIVEGLKRILILSKRRIEAGQELTYDYQSSHGLLNFPCSCGSTKCKESTV